MLTEPTPTPDAVINGIFEFAGVREAHSDPGAVSRAESILRALSWDSLNGCYMFWVCGMYVGVELDGYVHS